MVIGTQGISCSQHKECPALSTRNVLLRTQGMSFFEHKECPSSNTRNVLLQTQTMSSFEHKECPSSNIRNVLLRTQRMSFFVETTQKCDQCDHSNHTSYLQHCIFNVVSNHLHSDTFIQSHAFVRSFARLFDQFFAAAAAAGAWRHGDGHPGPPPRWRPQKLRKKVSDGRFFKIFPFFCI